MPILNREKPGSGVKKWWNWDFYGKQALQIGAVTTAAGLFAVTFFTPMNQNIHSHNIALDIPKMAQDFSESAFSTENSNHFLAKCVFVGGGSVLAIVCGGWMVFGSSKQEKEDRTDLNIDANKPNPLAKFLSTQNSDESASSNNSEIAEKTTQMQDDEIFARKMQEEEDRKKASMHEIFAQQLQSNNSEIAGMQIDGDALLASDEILAQQLQSNNSEIAGMQIDVEALLAQQLQSNNSEIAGMQIDVDALLASDEILAQQLQSNNSEIAGMQIDVDALLTSDEILAQQLQRDENLEQERRNNPRVHSNDADNYTKERAAALSQSRKDALNNCKHIQDKISLQKPLLNSLLNTRKDLRDNPDPTKCIPILTDMNKFYTEYVSLLKDDADTYKKIIAQEVVCEKARQTALILQKYAQKNATDASKILEAEQQKLTELKNQIKTKIFKYQAVAGQTDWTTENLLAEKDSEDILNKIQSEIQLISNEIAHNELLLGAVSKK